MRPDARARCLAGMLRRSSQSGTDCQRAPSWLPQPRQSDALDLDGCAIERRRQGRRLLLAERSSVEA